MLLKVKKRKSKTNKIIKNSIIAKKKVILLKSILKLKKTNISFNNLYISN